MIIREFSVICDGCGRVDNEKYEYSSDLKYDKTNEGWKFSNEAYCPVCVNESKDCLLCKVDLNR